MLKTIQRLRLRYRAWRLENQHKRLSDDVLMLDGQITNDMLQLLQWRQQLAEQSRLLAQLKASQG